jgi:signal transduction histidine kinase
MASRTVTRLRRYRRNEGPPSFWSRLISRAGILLLWLGMMALAYGLLTLTFDYANNKLDGASKEWKQKGMSAADRVERNWQTLGAPPAFARGDEPELRSYLDQYPLLVALRNLADGSFWIRKGDRLVPSDGSEDARRWEEWTRLAAKRPTFQWFPPKELNPDHGRNPVTVLTANQWIGVMRWQIGCPQVERLLQRLLKPDLEVRIGIRPDLYTTKDTPKEPWGVYPNLQADPGRIFELPPQYHDLNTNAFGEGFSMGVVPVPNDAKVMNSVFKRHFFAGAAISLTFILLLVGGMWVRYRMRRRSMLESDRLASLAHSLKTPLAILKFRCDSIRLGRLSQEESDAQLLRLGQEVDHLTIIIDSGLRAIKGSEDHKPTAEVTPQWIENVAADLEAAFESENRSLQLHLCPDPGQAVLASFRSALLTLMENGLEHGQGTVKLETRRHRHHLVVTISDEGPGLDQSALNALGKPFQRMRTSGSEGFQREGLGLGLSLLFHSAEQEGWGLIFHSEVGKGTTAELRIPLSRRGPLLDRLLAVFRPSPQTLEQH